MPSRVTVRAVRSTRKGPTSSTGTGADVEAQTGELSFNEYGQLVSTTVTANGDAANPYFNFSGGAAQNQQIGFTFGTSISDGGTGTDGVTQYGDDSTVLSSSQDGYAASSLSSISIDNAGKISATYTNGETSTFAQIAVASFRNVNGLCKVGDNLYAETGSSGSAAVGVAGSGGHGTISSSTLEQSNVDLATELVSMITTERGYQANSKSVSTADEMLQTVLAMKS